MTTKTEEEKTFDDYFEEAVADDEGKTLEPIDDKIDEEVVPDDQEGIVTDQEVDDETKDDETDEVDGQPADATEQLAEAQAEIAALQHKMSSWEGRITKANERAKAAEEKLAKQDIKEDVTDTDVSTSDDDDAVLKEFKDEFPDLVKPFKIMVTREAQRITDERLGKVTPVIEDIKQTQELTEQERFLAPIVAAHPDWKTIHQSGDLQIWIDTQPSLQQRVYNEIVTKGSQAEIIDLFDTYKKAKNISQKKTEPDKSGGDKKDMQDIVAVRAHSAGPTADSPDKDDFDKAWDEATSQK